MNLDELTDTTLEEIEYLKIEKENIPYCFTYDYGKHIFEFEISYNEVNDFFTADLYLLDGINKIPIVIGEKIMLNQMLFKTKAYLNINLPKLIPYDFSENSKRAGFDEIDNIYLVVVKDVAI